MYILKDGTPIFNDGTPFIIKVESQGPPNIELGVKPCNHIILVVCGHIKMRFWYSLVLLKFSKNCFKVSHETGSVMT